MGEGIMVALETIIEPSKDENGAIIRDAQGGVTMIKRREATVCWMEDRSHIFVHDLTDLEWVEVVAIRSLEEMKQEVIDDVLDVLENDGEPEVDGEPPSQDEDK